MKSLARVPVVVGCVFAVGLAVAELPYGGPFVNESMYPADADPREYFWVEVTLEDGDGLVRFSRRGSCEFPDPSFEAMQGDVNRVLLYAGEGRGRCYTVTSSRRIRIVAESRGGLVRVKADEANHRSGRANPVYRGVAPEEQKSNLELVRREVPVPAFDWGDAAGDFAKTESRAVALNERRRKEQAEIRRKELRRREEQDFVECQMRRREQCEKDQLAQVEAAKESFGRGEAAAGLTVSAYYAAYSIKLSDNGRAVEAVRAAVEAFAWLGKSAAAGCARARQSLGWHLLNGGSRRNRGPFEWSGPVPDIPKDNAFVHPGALQGTDVPADVLLSVTNGVARYFRVYARDPVEGVRQMKLAAAAGNAQAGQWIGDRLANRCDLAMPTWWLARDGFAVAGRQAVRFEEVVTRPGMGTPVKRRIGRDSVGNVVSVSDEYFQDPASGRWYENPWHESGSGYEITEVLP